MPSDHDELLRTQIEYYRARAGEYDDWFLRRGRYDRGPAESAAWFRDVDMARGWVDAWIPAGGDVLEFAAGTGLWTERLAARAGRVTALDAAPEALALNRERIAAARGAAALAPVEFVEADLFAWTPPRAYDAVFFGFWLSHVPPERFEEFWTRVRGCLVPGGSVCFVDSRYDPGSTAVDHRLEGEEGTTSLRRLDDGRTYRIVKVFYRAADLGARLAGLGWQCETRETSRFFLWGTGKFVTREAPHPDR